MFDFIGNCLNSSRFLTPLGQGKIQVTGFFSIQLALVVLELRRHSMNEQLVGLVPSMYLVCQDQTAAYARRIALSSELLYIAACWKNVEKSIMVTSTSICNATLTSLLSRFLISLLSFYMPILYIS